MPEVVDGGVVTFRVNGRVAQTVPSTLYQKVRIPVDPADVIADGTIGLTMTTAGPGRRGRHLRPRRRGRVDAQDRARATGARRSPPTTVGRLLPADLGRDHGRRSPRTPTPTCSPPASTAVAALAYRYADDTPIELAASRCPRPRPPRPASAWWRWSRVDAGEVTTARVDHVGHPDADARPAPASPSSTPRALSRPTRSACRGTDAGEPVPGDQAAQHRARPAPSPTSGIDEVALTGYGSARPSSSSCAQDSFGVPVSSMDLHLEGSHTAFAEGSGARLDVRVNGALVDSDGPRRRRRPSTSTSRSRPASCARSTSST